MSSTNYQKVRLFCIQPILNAFADDIIKYQAWLESILAITRLDFLLGANEHNLVVFPEYISQSLVYNYTSLQKYGQDILGIFSKIAQKEQVYLLASIPIRENFTMYNAAFLFNPQGEISISTKKINLTSSEIKLGFSCSPSIPTYCELPFGKVGIAICLDAFNADYIQYMKENGVKILLMPSANPQLWNQPAVDSGVWQPLEWTRAIVHAVQSQHASISYLVNPMMIGVDSEGRRFDGQSSIVASSTVLHDCPYIGVEKRFFAKFLYCSEYTNSQNHQVGWFDVQL